ncbi:MAG: hypothetical protein WCJ56_15655 [bacterium]
MHILAKIIAYIFIWGPAAIISIVVVVTCINEINTRRERREFCKKLAALADANPDAPSVAEDRDSIFKTNNSCDIPLMPMIEIGMDGTVSAIGDLTEEQTTHIKAIKKGYYRDYRYYSYDGRLWSGDSFNSDNPQIFKEGLIYTVKRNIVTYIPRWKYVRTYSLYELQEALCLCVDIDDDALTQFIDGDKLKKRIRAAESYNQILKVLIQARIIESRMIRPKKPVTGN